MEGYSEEAARRMEALANKLQVSRQRALELIEPYEKDGKEMVGKREEDAEHERQAQDVDVSDAIEHLLNEQTSESGVGFSVLDLSNQDIEKGLEDHRSIYYSELRAFVENRPQRSADRCLRQVKEKQLEKRKKIEKQLKLERIAYEERLHARADQGDKQAAEELEQIMQNRFKDKSGKNFIEFNKAASCQKKKRGLSLPSASKSDKKSNPGRQDDDDRRTHSPRKSPPSLLSPGHDTQVAWQGVPKDLQKLYFSPLAATNASNEGSSSRGSEDRSPTGSVKKSALVVDEGEPPAAAAAAAAEGKQQPTPEADIKNPATTAKEENCSTALTDAEKKARALNFLKTQYRGDGGGDDEQGKNAKLQHRLWLEKQAMKKRRQKAMGGKPAEQVTSGGRFARPSNEPSSLDGVKGDSSARSSPRSPRTRQEHKRALAYSELCRRAREKVLAERAFLLSELEKRRNAAVLLQRVLRRYVFKVKVIKARREMRKAVRLAMNIQAIRLQTIYRGHRARKNVKQWRSDRINAARVIQRLVRRNHDWIKLLKQSIAIELERKERKEKSNSQDEREHFEWIQRSIARTRKEQEGLERVKTQSLHPNETDVREWIVRAPTLVHEEDENDDEAAVETDAALVDDDDAKNEGATGQQSSTPRSQHRNSTKVFNMPRLQRRAINKVVPESGEQSRSAAAAQPNQATTRIPTAVGRAGATPTQLGHSVKPVVRHWDAHRQMVKAEQRSIQSVRPDEFTAMNKHISRELDNRVDYVHNRVAKLKTALVGIADRENKLPSLRFQK